ncbi:hypothetical protein [Vulcanisaeta moutnovskia]|nr:hypothetical protein [Vulcanisaeta moutnovskia]
MHYPNAMALTIYCDYNAQLPILARDFMVPLVLTKRHLDEGIRIFEDAIKELSRETR